MNALRLVCVHHGIFAPTFPVASMTLPQLEHAATSPMRFLTRLRRDLPTEPIRPVCTRVLTKLPAESEFEGTFLIPGGRFLITRSSRHLVELWDLGFTPDSVISSQPVASLQFTEGNVLMLGVQPTGDGLGISMMVEVKSHLR